MARKKSPLKPLFTLKGLEPDREWLEEFMEHLEEPSMADVVRRALAELAQQTKFRKPPFEGRPDGADDGRTDDSRKNPETRGLAY